MVIIYICNERKIQFRVVERNVVGTSRSISRWTRVDNERLLFYYDYYSRDIRMLLTTKFRENRYPFEHGELENR